MKKLEDLNKSYFGPRVSDGAGVFVAGFVFLYVFQIVLILIAEFTGVDVKNAPVWFTWIMMVVNQVAFVLAVFAYSQISRKPLLQECRINKKIHWKQAVIIPLIVIACILAFLPLAEGFVRLVALITKEKPDVGMQIGTQWWEILISLVFVSVLPAIGEEILFRAGVARGLKRKNYLFAIIMSGFMFSIFHGNAAQTVHQFLIGMVFAYIYFVTGSLLASALAHFLNNALALALEVTISKINIQVSASGEIAIYVVMSVVGFIALYFLLRYLMKVSKEVKGLPQNTDKMAWAKDLGKAFNLSGIKDNYNRLNNSFKLLFDDACDGIDLNGDLTSAKSSDIAENEGSVTKTTAQDDEMSKLLQEANNQTIAKRKRFDIVSLIVAIGIALAVWIINLV